MKRAILILLALLFCFSAVSCGKPHPADEPELTASAPGETEASVSPAPISAANDFDNRFGKAYASLVETDQAYYYCDTSGAYLYYYDKASGERGVLCGKPDCIHDAVQANKGCSGYIASILKSVNFWDGRLHYVATDQSIGKLAIFSMDLDGTGRQRDTVINDDEIMKTSGLFPQRLDYHRGKLYGWRRYETVAGAEPKRRTEIVSIDPKTGDLKVIYSIEDTCPWEQPKLYYFNDYVYFTYSMTAGTVNDFYTVLELWRWNIETEELEKVYATDEQGGIGSWFGIYMESEDRIYLGPVMSTGEEPVIISVLENGELSTAFQFSDIGTCFILEEAAVCISPKQFIEVRNLDGSLIFKGDYDFSFLDELELEDEYRIDVPKAAMGSSEELFIVYIFNSEQTGKSLDCLVRYDLTADEPSPVLIAVNPWS